MADYLQRLPAYCEVKIQRADGRVIRGTLMKVETDVILVQKDSRVKEPPISVPIPEIVRVTIETAPSRGKPVYTAMDDAVNATMLVAMLLLLLVHR
jgi:hypothetical protein